MKDAGARFAQKLQVLAAGDLAGPSLSTAGTDRSARRLGRDIDKHQRFAVAFEFRAGRQLEVRLGFVEGESVCKTHRVPTVAANAVAFLQAQALELIGPCSAIAASHFPRTTKFSAGRELSRASNVGIPLRMDSDCSGPAQMAYGLAQEKVIRHYRDNGAGLGK